MISPHRRDEPSDADIMRQRSQDHKDMPHFVKAKHAWEEVELLGGIQGGEDYPVNDLLSFILPKTLASVVFDGMVVAQHVEY